MPSATQRYNRMSARTEFVCALTLTSSESDMRKAKYLIVVLPISA